MFAYTDQLLYCSDEAENWWARTPGMFKTFELAGNSNIDFYYINFELFANLGYIFVLSAWYRRPAGLSCC